MSHATTNDVIVTRTEGEIEDMKEQVRKHMRDTLQQAEFERQPFYENDYVDAADQTVNFTRLAEDTAHALNLYLDDANLTIPEIVFEWAIDEGEKFITERNCTTYYDDAYDYPDDDDDTDD